MAEAEGARVIGMEELGKLSLEQIRQVKEQVDAELNLLQDSLSNIRTAANRFEMASKALNNLSHHPAGKKLLVPLTASLYIPGKLENTDKVLVDVGTGYYIEKTLPDGKDYCERKISFLKGNHEKLAEVAAEKRNASERVTMLLQKKLQQALPAK